MKKYLIAISLLALLSLNLSAQYITNGQDTLFGNEWINFDQTYFKIKVGQDGIYRISSQTLMDEGVPIGQITGEKFQLWHNGEQVPIYTTTENNFGGSDYLEFFGKKNTSELDRFLFKDPDSMMMNPFYSLITDTSAYFLTWVNDGGNMRYQIISNDLNNLPAKEDYYMATLLNNSVNVARKKANSEGISASDFSEAEGFSTDFAFTKSFTLNPTSIYTGSVGSTLSLRFTGNSGQHQQVISLNDQPIFTSNFYDNQVQKPTIDLTNSQLASSMVVKFQGMISNTDRQRVSNIVLNYPRTFDFENKASYSFDMTTSNSVRYLEINNFNFAGGEAIFYDLTNHQRVIGTIENGLVKIALPPSTTSRSLVLINNNTGAISLTDLIPTSFIDFDDKDNDYIIVTGRGLLNDGAGNNRVQEYADYRASLAGGSFNPIVVEAEQLYDQFSWGIERHPFSVRNFALFVKKKWSDPKYLFIIGKGREYTSFRTASGLQSALNFGFYVPTYSFPGSDNMLLAGEDGFTPVIPVGRLAALNPEDVDIYLDKIKEFEANRYLPQTLEDRAWMKNVLHMGGGLTAGEQSSIRSYLAQMESIIENSSFGGHVKSFYKSSSDPIQVSQTEQIFDFINNGTTIISFFGHSAVGTFDFSIDNPANFNNKGKYPMLFSLGCYSGNIHTGTQGIGERFVLYKDKGAIAFGGTSGQGYASSLSTFSTKVYDNIGNTSYGEGVGDIIVNVISSIGLGDFGVDLVRQQFNLHGDPAIKLNPQPGPDFLIDPTTVKFNPGQITTQMSDFELRFDIVNIGSAVNDSILITIIHELPSGEQLSAKELLVKAPSIRDSFICSLPTLGDIAQGFNKFYITVDADDRVKELPNPVAELNNDLTTGGTTGINVYFSDNSVKTIFPTQFSIVGDGNFELIASTTEPLLPERMYIFQIDTTELFDSPKLIMQKLSQAGGVLKWKPNINMKNEAVYYWRVSPDSISVKDGYLWDNSSFVYLDGSQGGWNQSHFYQWKKDEFDNMELKTHENLKFIDDYKDVFIRNAVNSVNNMELQINNAFSGRMYPTPPGMYVTVFDSTSAKQWINVQPSQYGLLNPSNHNVAMYLFSTQDLAGRTQLIDFFQQVIPTKSYVLAFTNQISLTSDYKPQDWETDQALLGTDLFQVLESQGATLIRNTITTGSLPYIFAFQKDVGPIAEELADSLTQILRVNFGIPGYWDRGSVKSTPIGPASVWTKLIWDNKQVPNSETDTFSVDLLAYNPITLTDTVLLSGLAPGEYDLANISASSFPYLKMRFNSEDSLIRTSAQPTHWRVLYQGVPDFAVNPSGGYVFESDTLQQGNPFYFKCLVENLSDYAGDSLLVKYSIRNGNNEENVIIEREDKLLAHDTLFTDLRLETQNLNGKYALTLELNPADEQKELIRINNVLSTNFSIYNDLRNPLLDVTFDGIHILDGDLVSAKPTIKVTLKDENPYLLLNDTALIRVYITYPDSNDILKRVYFNDPNLVFYPANSNSDNKAMIELRPNFIQDGDYRLIVQAEDVTGNSAGQIDYKIAFKVITKSSISNFLNYPNPFTTATQFVYTMTGAEPPAQYKLQIMSISGKIVREITQAELGPLRVGTHQTDFIWDGTDEFGDVLAKGVYLYRVLVQDATGKNWDGFENGTDKYFAKGMGKMVLLR